MLKPNPTAQDCIAVLAELVKFDTTSRNSNLDLIEFVRAQLDAIGIGSRLTFNEEKTKANLWATIGPDIEGGIVLSGHTDVVPVDGQDWASDPFELTEREGRLFARGTCDMKGFVACALTHAQAMANAELKVPIHYAFSYDEEVGCVGVKGLIKDLQENLPKPLAVIVGEPTSMQIVGAHKGGHSFVTTVRGLDGHSSAPDLGANAIFYAARILNFIEKLRERIKAEGDPTNGFDPYYTTVDCGVIKGGTARNIIPALCEFSWGFRNVPGDDTHAFAQEVFDFIEKEIEPELKAISPECGVSHEEQHYLPAMIPDETSPAETLLRHLTGLNQSGRVAYGTEAAHFQNAGVPGVIFGPGSIKQAHLPDEYIDISQMEACHDFLLKLTDWAATTGKTS
ncbi:MAG: acetylornithine deacetylase [Hyphomicrobiales bacterium]|nr:acetylornithine deacetylase [Hyphomicrobiales bacterium]